MSSLIAEVKNYLEKTNRPFSANDVFNNLNTNDRKLSKTGVTRALEDLSGDQLIVEKINGKQKIYFADQNNFEAIDDNQIKQIDEESEQLSREFKEVETELKSKESKLNSLKNNRSLEEVSQELTQIKGEVNELENKLEAIDSNSKDFDPELNDKIKSQRKALVTEWKKRKRMAVDMIDQILSGDSSKPKKAFIEELGIETDEDINLSLPQI